MTVKGQHIRKGEDVKKWQENYDKIFNKDLTEEEPREIMDTETQKSTKEDK